MFTRTARLLLRPGWAEDAPALAEAIGDKRIVCNLASAPWPYRMSDAEEFLARPRDPVLPSLLIFARTDGDPLLIGACGLRRKPSGGVELGYWIEPRHWGRGYATEGSRALIATARDGLRLKRLEAGHFLDNPASGRVLEKLGFGPTGIIVPRYSAGRGEAAPCRLFQMKLGTTVKGATEDKAPPAMIAA